MVEITEDPARNQHGQQPSVARCRDGIGDIDIDLVVHGNGAVEVEGEDSRFHVSATRRSTMSFVPETVTTVHHGRVLAAAVHRGRTAPVTRRLTWQTPWFR